MLAPMAGVSVADERPSVTVDGVTIYDGDLISSNATNPDGTPTYESLDIYIAKVVSDTETYKRLILNPQVFDSYGHLNWGDVKEVDQSVMDSFTTSDLVRQDGTDEVYSLVADDDTGTKHWVNLNETQFIDEAGADPDSIYTVNSTDIGNYTTGAAYTDVQSFIDRTPPAEAVGTGLTVALASDTPAAATIVDNSFAEVARFNFTASSDGDVTVQNIIVTRSGVGSSSDFDGVYLYDGTTRLTSGKSVSSSDNKAEFNNVNIVIPAGTTEVLSLWADAASGASGNHAFGIADASDITTDSAAVSGSFPITGNTMSYSDQAEGSITVNAGTSASDPTLGETGAVVEKFSITANTENATIYRMMFKQVGTADMAYLTNFALYQAGTKIADGVVNGKYVSFELDTPYTINSGLTKSFEVRTDIGAKVTPTNRISLDLYEAVDIYAVGGTFGYGLAVTDSKGTGDNVQVLGGDVTFADNGPSAGDIKDGGNDVTLLNFSITSQSDITVKDLDLIIQGTDNTGMGYLDDIRIKNADTGATVSGPHDAPGTATAEKIDFSDDFSVSAGTTLNLQVTADINSSADSSDHYTVYVVTADSTSGTVNGLNTATTPVAAPVIEDSEGNTITTIVPSTHIVGELMTVAEPYLTVALASNPAGQLVVKGSTDVELMGFVLEASSADDLTVNDITLKAYAYDNSTPPAAVNAYDVVSNVRLYNAATGELIAGPKNISSSTSEAVFTSVNLDIPAGQNVKVVAKGDISGGLSAIRSFAFDIVGDGSSATGVTTNITATDTDGSGVTIYDEDADSTSGDWSASDTELNDWTTVGASTLDADGATDDADVEIEIMTSGYLVVSKSANSPVDDILIAGSTDNEALKVDFKGEYEAFNVEKLTFTVGTAAAVNSLTLEYLDSSGATVTNTKSVSGTSVVFSNMTMYVPKDKTRTLTVTADINTITGGATAADNVGVDLGIANGDMKVVGESGTVDTNPADSSGVITKTSGSVVALTAINGGDSLVYETKPTLALASGSPSGSRTQSTTDAIMKFNVTVPDNGESVKIRQGNSPATCINGAGSPGVDAAYTVDSIDGSACQMGNSAAIAQNDSVSFNVGAGTLDDFTRISFWIYQNDANSNDTMLAPSTLFVSTNNSATVVGTNEVAVGSSVTAYAEGEWVFIDAALPTTIAITDTHLHIKYGAATQSDTGDYVIIDQVRLYNEKIAVDLASNGQFVASTGADGASASLKKDGTTVATGYIEQTSTSAATVTFIPVDTYSTIEFSANTTSEMTVVVDTSSLISQGSNDDLLTPSIDYGTSSVAGDFYWYESNATVSWLGYTTESSLTGHTLKY